MIKIYDLWIRIQLDFTVLLTPLQASLHSVFTTRIIINIRVAGRQPWNSDLMTDLHTWHRDDANVDAALPLAFRSEGEEHEVEDVPPSRTSVPV